jgi:hypothetical protein
MRVITCIARAQYAKVAKAVDAGKSDCVDVIIVARLM